MIDLFSDTKTRPNSAMREAMARAEVGDDHWGEDPTVLKLQESLAAKLGFEAGMFLPSATMANQIAVKIHTNLGDAVICHENCHINLYEGGTPAALSGVILDTLPGPRGVFTGAQVKARIRPEGMYFPPTKLVCIENTHNYCGGSVWTPTELFDVEAAAKDAGLALHLDGSRLFNAAVKLGGADGVWEIAKTLCAPFDTVTICLTKGLGAPIGAVLLGSRELVEKARRWKHALGGAMRQSGIVAAAGLYALENNLTLLAEDHRRAEALAQGLAEIPGVKLDPWPETNLVFAEISGTGLAGSEIQARLRTAGVLCSGGGNRLRFVTHLDISDADIAESLAIIRRVTAR